MTPLNTRELTQAIKIDLEAGLVPYVKGSPGLGKSAVVMAIARAGNLKPIIVHMSMYEPTDINGMPDVSGSHAVFKTFETFPTEDTPKPLNDQGQPYAGWLLFLDEFNSASQETQAACYSVILDHKVGQKLLHKDCYVIGAGNLKTDNAIVNTQSSAITSRVVNYQIEFDHTVFMEDVVIPQKWNMFVAGYLEFKPDAVYTFDPGFAEDPYACPRTWDMLNKRIEVQSQDQWEDGRGNQKTGFNYEAKHNLAATEGLVGQDTGREFIAFVRTFGQIPSPQEIMADPIGITMPATRGLQFASIIQLRAAVDHTNLADAYPFVERMDPEFRVAFLRGVIHDPDKGISRSHPVIVDAQRNLRKRNP